MRARSRMTVAELKTHVDRRLRHKADKADVRRLEEKLEEKADKADLRRLEARMVDRFNHVSLVLARIEQKLEDVERNTRHHKTILDNHERRLTDLETHQPA